MKISVYSFISLFFIFFLFSFYCLPQSSAKTILADDNINPQEFIQKHLESIGSDDTRKSITSIMAVGESETVYKGISSLKLKGVIVLASQNENNMFGMKFDNPDYRFELMGFDGDKVSVGYATPGIRTPLGNFILSHQKTFKIGIMGGILSTGWELLKYDEKRGKLKYMGTKNIDGTDLLRFSYSPKKGSDLDINLFFEKSTFRHVRTEYTRVISAPMGKTINESARQIETRYKLIEQFGDFKPENGLNFPHDYYIYLEILSGKGSISYDWIIGLQQFTFNQKYDITQFRIGDYK
jgi:hypothetical protein